MPAKKISSTRSKNKTSKRKPASYWNDFANVERELRVFISRHSINGIMPTGTYLDSQGRSDLHRAIGIHGGFPSVAQLLKLERPHALKPTGYWSDFKNVEKELLSFISEHGEEGVMPTQPVLADAGHSDLVNAIRRHGGTPSVAERLGLSRPNAKKPSGYWDSFANVQKELHGFILNFGTKGMMPTASELSSNGRIDLVEAISKYGGFPVVSDQLGLKRRIADMPDGYWDDFANVEKELRNFVSKHGRNGVMPTNKELNKAGSSGLAKAINKHGGFVTVSDKIGLSHPDDRKPINYWADFTNVESELHSYISLHGIAGVMPTQNELKRKGRIDLAGAIHKHGGLVTVAKKLGLERPNAQKSIGYWNNLANVEKELRDFISAHNMGSTMPTVMELINAARADLVSAIGKHGGFAAVAEQLGLERPNAYARIGYWNDFANVERELRDFISQHGVKGVMPSVKELNTYGRADLADALERHSGFSAVARRLGLAFIGHEHVTPRTASSVEKIARAIQPLAESSLLSGAQVMIILRRAGLLEFRNKRVLKLNASLAHGDHAEIESAIANLSSGGEEIVVETVEIEESDALTLAEAEALLSGGLDEKDRPTPPLSTSIAPDVESEQAVIRGLSALGELRLPLDEVLSLLTSKILWQEFYKRLYAWYGSLDAAQTVTTQDVEAAILSAYPEHTSNEFVAEASAIFTVEVEQAVNFAASLNDYGWRGPRLRLHQADAARRMVEVLSGEGGTFILDADDPGMGKSASFLAAVAVSGMRSIILIAPKTVADDTWVSTSGEIHRCLPDARIVRGIDKAITHKDSSRLAFFVLHYEELLNDEAMATLVERSFDCLCLDEIHFIKQRAGKEETNRRKAINGLRACSRVAIGLTGTPLVNELSEPMSLLQTLSQNAPQFDHSRLSNRRLSDIADVFEALLPHIIRRRKINVLLHLPHCDVREVEIPMLGLEDEMLELHRLPKSQASHALVELRKVATEAKLPYLQSRAQSARKILILTYLTDDVSQRIYEYLQDFIPDQVAHINGATSRDDRKKILNAFRSSENVRVLVGTIGTIGTGLTLFDPSRPDTANEIIVADLPYTWAEFEQGIARLHREGQKQRVMVEVLLTQIATTLSDGSPYITIDEGVWTLIKSKSELSDVAIDGKYDTTDAASKVQKALRRWLKQTREVGVEPLAVERRRAEQTEAQRWRSEIGRLRGMSAMKADEAFADPQYTQEFLAHLQTSTAAKLSHDWLKGRLDLLMRSDLVIVDMGCGLNPFADLPCRVIGLDRHDREGQLRGKMENPSLDDKSADVIIYGLSLYGTASDLFSYFTHAARVLRGGGHLFIVEPESAFTQEGLIRFVNGLRQFGFELVGSVKDLRGEDGTLLKGMHLTLSGEIGKPEEMAFERK